MPRRTYKNPPIHEALCDFRFNAGAPWDLTIPGRMFGALRADYDGKPRNVMHDQVQLEGPGQPGVTWNRALVAVQLADTTGKALLTVGPDLLTVHQLRPYPSEGWRALRPRVERGLKEYATIAAPGSVRRIGVRYINHISLPEPEPNLDTYFTWPPTPMPGLEGKLKGFIQRAEYACDEATRVLATFAPLGGEPTATQYLLDIDVSWEGSEPRPAEKAMAIVDALRDRERDAFEGLITDKLREVFDA